LIDVTENFQKQIFFIPQSENKSTFFTTNIQIINKTPLLIATIKFCFLTSETLIIQFGVIADWGTVPIPGSVWSTGTCMENAT
jgi:hypothetical protein